MTNNVYNENMLNKLHQEVVFGLESEGRELSTENVEAAVIKILGEADSASITKRLMDRIFGYGVLTDILKDSSITEVMVNGASNIFIEKAGKLEKLDLKFESEEDLLMVINRMVSAVGRRVDASSPMCDARLADGSRVNVIIPPLSITGPILTIRRFPIKALSINDLVSNNSLTAEMAEFLKRSVRDKMNIIISGGTGGGKTTLLNALASEIPTSERLITIEDSAEMRIDHPHLFALEARQANIEGAGDIPIRSLVKNALRMRPDRIIVGEIRSGEALDMLQAMNTGHQGSLTTVHANAPLEALLRIETMCLMSDVKMPHEAIKQQIKQAIHIILQQERLTDGTRKITSIAKVTPKDRGYDIQEVYRYDKTLNQFVNV